MRKVNDFELLDLIQKGIPQKDIAAQFGVSPAFISKRKKQLQEMQEPESFSRLTDKKKKFVLAKAEGKTNVDAAMIAFDVTSRESAKVLGCNLAKDPDVSTAIQDLLYQEGLGRRNRIKRLKQIVYGPDMSVALRGIDVANRMDGAYSPIEVEFNTRSMVAQLRADIEQLDRAKAKLLAEIAADEQKEAILLDD